MQTLFDENGMLNVAQIVAEHPSYKAIMEDGVVSDQELSEQTQRALRSLKILQAICTPEQQSAILDAIGELSVLNAVYHHYELQNAIKL